MRGGEETLPGAETDSVVKVYGDKKKNKDVILKRCVHFTALFYFLLE